MRQTRGCAGAGVANEHLPDTNEHLSRRQRAPPQRMREPDAATRDQGG
ncbi:MAG: hypothetical protein H7138_16610 [Myxococcales bacterium]|nr:hypothetical protein [Myxococcales bacterium]